MKSLNGVLERRAVSLSQNIRADLDDSVRTHPEEEAIKGSVMQPAQCQTVADDRLTLRFRVWNYVGGVQQLTMAETTEGTLMSICLQNKLPKRPLVQSTTGD